MASATSSISVVTTGTSVRNKKKTYYKTEVTRLADGSLKRETFRTDAQGNNTVKIQEVNTNKDGKITSNTTTSNITTQEKTSLKNPNSSLRRSILQQTNQAGKKVEKNEAESRGGGLTSIGKKNVEVVGGNSGNDAQEEPGKLDTSQPANIPATKQTARKKFDDNITYPLGLGSSKQDVIMFTMLEYQPRNLSTSKGMFGFSERDSGRKGIGSVILPVPGGIQDTNAVQWGSSNMNALEILTGILALKGIKGDWKGMAKAGTDAMGTATGSGQGDVKTAISTLMAGAATGTGQQILQRTAGAIVNPNMELLFNGPQLRPFSFNFKLSPRSKKEAENVIRIIRFFKQGMSPIKSDSNLFLKSPHTFKIQYKLRGSAGEDHPYIGKVKECGLQSCAVQYTPEGSYATYHDGTMASYQIMLTFSELEPIFNNDYKDDNDQSLGF